MNRIWGRREERDLSMRRRGGMLLLLLQRSRLIYLRKLKLAFNEATRERNNQLKQRLERFFLLLGEFLKRFQEKRLSDSLPSKRGVRTHRRLGTASGK